MVANHHHRLQCRFFVDTESGAFLSDTRVSLLEAIEELGSISSAAKCVGISYKTAWDLVGSINTQTGTEVVIRSVGGYKGGGSRLTDYGRRLVAFYRAVEWDYQLAIDELATHLGIGAESCNFRYLLKRRGIQRSTPDRKYHHEESRL